MKVELSEKMEKLFTLMDDSKILPLKKFVCDIKSFKAVNKIKSKPVCAYTGAKRVYDFKEFSCTYTSTVRTKEDGDIGSVSYINSVNNRRLESAWLTVNGNCCELALTNGKQREKYSFKYNSKRVYQFVDLSKQKDIEK